MQLVSNVRVYGLDESIIASGYPMLEKALTEEEFENRIKEYQESNTGDKRADRKSVV